MYFKHVYTEIKYKVLYYFQQRALIEQQEMRRHQKEQAERERLRLENERRREREEEEALEKARYINSSVTGTHN